MISTATNSRWYARSKLASSQDHLQLVRRRKTISDVDALHDALTCYSAKDAGAKVGSEAEWKRSWRKGLGSSARR